MRRWVIMLLLSSSIVVGAHNSLAQEPETKKPVQNVQPVPEPVSETPPMTSTRCNQEQRARITVCRKAFEEIWNQMENFRLEVEKAEETIKELQEQSEISDDEKAEFIRPLKEKIKKFEQQRNALKPELDRRADILARARQACEEQ